MTTLHRDGCEPISTGIPPTHCILYWSTDNNHSLAKIFISLCPVNRERKKERERERERERGRGLTVHVAARGGVKVFWMEVLVRFQSNHF